MSKLAATPKVFERELAYFVWTLFTSGVVLWGVLKLVE